MKNENAYESISAPFPADEDKPYLFVSYSHRDRRRVFPILRRLYERGWRLWYDEGLEIGEEYDSTLRAHEEDCAAVLLFLSSNSVISRYINQYELPQAQEFEKPVLVCRLDEGAAFERFDLSSYPEANPDGLETLLDKAGVAERGPSRVAKPRQIRISLAVAAKDSEYEFGRCTGGVRLMRYSGSDIIVHVPEEYPPGSGLKVVETSMTFFEKNDIKEVHFPPTLRKIGMATFGCVIVPGENTQVYVPSSVTEFEKDWCGKLYLTDVQKEVTLHCAKGSAAWIEGSKRGFVTLVKDPSMAVTPRQEWKTYAFISYAGEKGREYVQILRDEGGSLISQDETPRKELERRIRGCACFIAFIDHDYLAGEEIHSLRMAYALDKKISLYYLDDSELPEDLEELADQHSLKYNAGNEEERTVRLANWLSANGCRELSRIRDFEYIVEDGVLILTKYQGGSHAVIRPEYGGFPVRSIFPKAFMGCIDLLSVEIPDGVEIIGEEAFRDCINLDEVIIPDSVTKIGPRAFYGCSSLSRIRLPEHLEDLNNSMFTDCSSLAKVTVPSGTRRIWNNAFDHCTGLRELILSEGLEELGLGMLEGCKGLWELTVPGSVKKIGRHTLGDCPGLRKVVLCDGVEEIEGGAFSHSQNLEIVEIPSSVRTYPENAFGFCCSLRVPQIPESILHPEKKQETQEWPEMPEDTKQKKTSGGWWWHKTEEEIPDNIRRIQAIRNPLKLLAIATDQKNRYPVQERCAAIRRIRSDRILLQILEKTPYVNTQCAAVSAMTSQKLLEKIAMEHMDEFVRQEAVRKITSKDVILRVAKKDENRDVRIAAVNRLTDRKALIAISETDSQSEVRLAALEKLADSGLFRRILKEMSGGAKRRYLTERIRDQELLEELAKGDPYTLVRETAVLRLTNRELLERIAAEDPEPWIRRAASRRLGVLQST